MRRFPGYSPILVVGLFAACGTDSPVVPESDTSVMTTQVNAEVEWFVDRAEATGLNFIHFNGMTGGFEYSTLLPRDDYTEHSFQLNFRAEF